MHHAQTAMLNDASSDISAYARSNMMFLLNMVIVVGLTAMVGRQYAKIRSVATRSLLAFTLPLFLASAINWTYMLIVGGYDSQGGGWTLMLLTILLLPSYLVSLIFLFNSLDRGESIDDIKNGGSSGNGVSTREFLGALIAPLVPLVSLLLMSSVFDVIGRTIIAYMAMVIYGIPAYKILKEIGRLQIHYFVGVGCMLGVLLPIFFIWLLNPDILWLRDRQILLEYLNMTGLSILFSIAISIVFWLIVIAPVSGLFAHSSHK